MKLAKGMMMNHILKAIKILKKILENKEKMNKKLLNKNLLTIETIADILKRLSVLEKFRKFMETINQNTDSKISYLESIINNGPRQSIEEFGVPTTINSNKKIISPLLSRSLNRINEYNISLNDDILLSKRSINNYNFVNTSKKSKVKKIHI